MSPEKIFSLCSTLAMISWIILIFFTFWKNRDRYLLASVIILFCLIYAWLIFSNMSPGTLDSFGTLDGVSKLFSNKTVLLAGWVHYLAFDLLAGIYIVRNARQVGINHWLLVPALILTFMLGPVGLLIYFIMRLFKTKNILDN